MSNCEGPLEQAVLDERRDRCLAGWRRSFAAEFPALSAGRDFISGSKAVAPEVEAHNAVPAATSPTASI
jgi:hypothetical protein